MSRFEKLIMFCRQPAKVACDGKCNKAWGIDTRPRVYFSGNASEIDPSEEPDRWQRAADDYAYLSDEELGEAPACPRTWEGSHGKPVNAKGPEDFNKWCVRQCERNVMSMPGEEAMPLPLPDFSRRVYNIPSLHSEVSSG